MVTDLFSAILHDLGPALKIPDLHPDKSNTCLIQLLSGAKVQIEIDKSEQFLIIESNVGTIPQGRYRENVFREALKANGLPWPHYGTFAYSRRADKLIIFEMLPLKEISTEKIMAVLTPLAEKALIWSTAIAKGDLPLVQTATANRGKGMFGL